MAAAKDYYTIVCLLLQYGADINLKGEYQWTALHIAASKGFDAIVCLLLQSGADINNQDASFHTALHRASAKGHAAVVWCLVEHGADINIVDARKKTPLYRAVDAGHETIVSLLLAYGAKLNIKDEYGRKSISLALDLAVTAERKAILTLLLRAESAQHNHNHNQDKQTTLHNAIDSDNVDLFKYLLNAGADLNLKNNLEYTPREVALLKNKENIVKYIIQTPFFGGGASDAFFPLNFYTKEEEIAKKNMILIWSLLLNDYKVALLNLLCGARKDNQILSINFSNFPLEIKIMVAANWIQQYLSDIRVCVLTNDNIQRALMYSSRGLHPLRS